MTFKYFKKADLICKILAASLIVSGTVVGGVTLNPIILGSVSGAGRLLKTYSEAKNFKRKAKLCRFAFTSYEKILVDVRSNIRGLAYDNKKFLDRVQTVDDIIIDLCPNIPIKYEETYKKLFMTE